MTLALLALTAFAHGPDGDDDGWEDDVDCAIADPAIYPGADECGGGSSACVVVPLIRLLRRRR